MKIQTATNSLRFRVQLQLSEQSQPNILNDVVTGNSCYDDARTASAKYVSATRGEEGIRGKSPSSFEIPFPAELAPTCLNTTHVNIKRHACQH